jgi:hypothetical protein
MTHYIATYSVPIYFTVDASNPEDARDKADAYIERIISRISEEDRMGPSFDVTDRQFVELISEEDL